MQDIVMHVSLGVCNEWSANSMWVIKVLESVKQITIHNRYNICAILRVFAEQNKDYRKV